MHQSSYSKMQAFREHYLAGREAEELRIYDVGSQDVNGSYRPLFAEHAWKYVGLDSCSGKNVDIVLRCPYAWGEISSKSADVVISGQAFEHIEFFWTTMLEIARVLKPHGLCCIIAPSGGPEHRYPTDCWRFYPDGMNALARFAEMDVMESSTEWGDNNDPGSACWHDSLLVCRKSKKAGLSWVGDFKRWLRHSALTMGLK